MQHGLLQGRASLDLFGQQSPDPAENRAPARLVQERAKLAAEQLTDAFTDHLQRQAIASESR